MLKECVLFLEINDEYIEVVGFLQIETWRHVNTYIDRNEAIDIVNKMVVYCKYHRR